MVAKKEEINIISPVGTTYRKQYKAIPPGFLNIPYIDFLLPNGHPFGILNVPYIDFLPNGHLSGIFKYTMHRFSTKWSSLWDFKYTINEFSFCLNPNKETTSPGGTILW